MGLKSTIVTDGLLLLVLHAPFLVFVLVKCSHQHHTSMVGKEQTLMNGINY